MGDGHSHRSAASSRSRRWRRASRSSPSRPRARSSPARASTGCRAPPTARCSSRRRSPRSPRRSSARSWRATGRHAQGVPRRAAGERRRDDPARRQRDRSSTTRRVAYALLLFATSSLGVGFGFTVPALNTFTAAFNPDKVDSSVLVLNALLGRRHRARAAVRRGVRRPRLLVGSADPRGRHRSRWCSRSSTAPAARGRRGRRAGAGGARCADPAALLDLRRLRGLLRHLRDDERQLGVAST